MRMYDIIIKKRDGLELSKSEINYFVENYTNGNIPDYQISALLMAIYFKNMTLRETVDLTMAMVNSGETLDLSRINGLKVDKHSTGGVGDTTSLVVTPMVAALGIPVAKMSGRGLGHTGGTIDKLESFSGFNVGIKQDDFIRNVNNIKISIMAQTLNLVPADKKLYALRDVTGTVENISLIASSIMSKKIASGADAIVLDVKVGDGAFMKTIDKARQLARLMVDIGKSVKINTTAIISDMNQPLGFAIGNSLEVKEAIETLKGNGPKDLLEICLYLGSNMVLLANRSKSITQARKMLLKTIDDGSALNKFKEFVEAQGGNPKQIENTNTLPKAKYIVPVFSEKAGYITKIHSQNIGIVAMKLGAGREFKEDNIDLGVGIVLNKKIGDKIKKGEIIAYIHFNEKTRIDDAIQNIKESYDIEKEPTKDIPLIYDVLT